jgi:hypothetical protein
MLRFAQRTLFLWAALAVLAITAPPARSQHIGDVSLTTTTQTLATAVSCTGNPQIFPIANIGQSFHLASAALVSGSGALGMEVDGVDAVNSVFKISNPMIQVGTSSFLVQGTGFMPIIRIVVTCTSGSTFSLSYSGSFASNPIANVGASGSGNTTTTIGGQVQGVIPSGQNGVPINPVIAGGVQQAINGGFLNLGLDTYKTQGALQPGCSGPCNVTFTFTPPPPSKAGEWGLVWLLNTLIAGGSNVFVPGDWLCLGTGGNCSANTTPQWASIALKPNSLNQFSWAYTAAAGPNLVQAAFVELNNPPTVRQDFTAAAGSGSVTPLSSTLAGSTLVLAIGCPNTPPAFPCAFNSVTDTQGLRWKNLENISGPGGGLSIWMPIDLTTAAADTITITPAAGTTISNGRVLELTGLLPSTLNTPSTPLLTDPLGRLVPGNIIGSTDPCQTPGALKLSAPINIVSATTTQLIPLVANQTIYPCGGYVEIASSATTAATIQFEYGTGAACAVGTNVLTGAMGTGTATAGISAEAIEISGGLMNWSIPVQNALCAVTAGTAVNAQGWITYVQQ